MRWTYFVACLGVLAVLALAVGAHAAPADLSAAPVAPVSVHSLPPSPGTVHTTPPFDPAKATNAYLARVSGKARARSDAYFEGGYVLILVDTVYAVAVSALLLWLGLSAHMRDLAQRLTRSRFFQVPIYVVMYVVITTVMTFPLTLYEDFFREHSYGLSNQNFLQWLGDFGIESGVNIVIFAVGLALIYAVIRASRRLWWAWGTLVAVALVFFLILIEPVFIAPLLNHYQPLREGTLKTEILTLAHGNGIPATDVYEFDASRQTKRVSANVSGFLGTTRISLNDNLLNRCTPAEIEAVLGHEMGHYVLNHVAIGITWNALLFLVAFLFLDWGFGALVGAFGGNWGVRSIDDPAGLPVLMALLSVFMLFATPVSNTITRTLEAQADIFGLNAARQPDGFAQSALMLSEYRKLDPSPLEEFIFFDHPSGRTRIAGAMRWKAAHINDPDIKAGPVSPQ